MNILRFRWKQVGTHIEVKVSTGTSFTGTFARVGELVFNIDEWKVYATNLPAFSTEQCVVQVKESDEL